MLFELLKNTLLAFVLICGIVAVVTAGFVGLGFLFTVHPALGAAASALLLAIVMGTIITVEDDY